MINFTTYKNKILNRLFSIYKPLLKDRNYIDIPLNFIPTPSSLKSYKNLENLDNLNQIRHEYKNSSIVYGIENNITKQIYIGSTSNPKNRLYSHLILQKTNILLSNSIKKYGLNNFTLHIFYVLKLNNNNTHIIVKTKTYDNLNVNIAVPTILEKEQELLNLYPLGLYPGYGSKNSNQLYNFLPQATSSLGYIHRKETIEKMKQTRTNLKGKSVYVYAYLDKNMYLINNTSFLSYKRAAIYLGISSMSILNNLDTFKASNFENKYYYLFSFPLDINQIISILINPIIKTKAPKKQKVYVYKLNEGKKLVPISSIYSFNSIRKASIALNLSNKTISLKLKQGKNQVATKNLYFFYNKIN